MALGLAATSAARKSVTVDEVAHLPQGLLYWSSGHTGAGGTPPLAAALAALPLHASGVRLAVDEVEDPNRVWAVARTWTRSQGDALPELVARARWLPLAALAALLAATFGYARSLHGSAGGLLALALAAFSPNLLAHGRLATPDVFFALGVVASLWSLDALLRRPSATRAAVLGAAVGFANLCKFSGLLLNALLPALVLGVAVVQRVRRADRDDPFDRVAGATAGWLAGGLILSLAVVQAGYLGVSLPALGGLELASGPMRAVQALLPGWLPSPWPAAFLLGLDAQLAESGYPAYLLGEVRTSGFAHYYLVALAVKVPLATWLVWGLAAWGRPGPSRREVLPLAAAAAALLFFSLAGHKNIGLRYLLFVLPLLAVWAGRIASPARGDAPGARRLRVVAVAALAVQAAVALWSWPNYLPYFNALAGGPSGGHRVLLDSNLDWGQDLIALREYMAREGIESVDLAYFGRVDPAAYGIRYRPLGRTGGAPARHVVLSAHFLYGLPYFLNGTDEWLDNPQAFAPLRRRTPKAVLGHSLYVFEIGGR